MSREDTEEVPVVLQEVLDNFKDVFVEPKRLPPCRKQDYEIVSKEGMNAINCRPHRYGAL